VETLTHVLLWVEVVSFIAFGAVFFAQGQWRLGSAQVLLAGVQWVIYSGKMA
jgi:hypothetical protein